jgi:hypothetical protein
VESKGYNAVGTHLRTNTRRRPVDPNQGSSLPQDGGYPDHFRLTPHYSSVLGDNVIPDINAQVTRPMPLTLNLHTVKDVRAALDALQVMEKFLEHVEKQLTPDSPRMLGQWRTVFDCITDQLCERKRSMKRAMYAGQTDRQSCSSQISRGKKATLTEKMNDSR